MIPRSIAEKINRGEMTEEEFRIVALEFAKVVSEKARGMFKKREKYDDYIIEYYIVETMRFFFGYPPILFYSNLRVDKELRSILNLRVLKNFANYEDFRTDLNFISFSILKNFLHIFIYLANSIRHLQFEKHCQNDDL